MPYYRKQDELFLQRYFFENYTYKNTLSKALSKFFFLAEPIKLK